MYDSKSTHPNGSWYPYWINIGGNHVLRFPTYRNAYAHSYRNKFPPIWFDDAYGTHLCEHVNGQERYVGRDPGMAVAVKWAKKRTA